MKSPSTQMTATPGTGMASQPLERLDTRKRGLIGKQRALALCRDASLKDGRPEQKWTTHSCFYPSSAPNSPTRA